MHTTKYTYLVHGAQKEGLVSPVRKKEDVVSPVRKKEGHFCSTGNEISVNCL
jgi:hypothetical protein